jgi:hypothetical protein
VVFLDFSETAAGLRGFILSYCLTWLAFWLLRMAVASGTSRYLLYSLPTGFLGEVKGLGPTMQ